MRAIFKLTISLSLAILLCTCLTPGNKGWATETSTGGTVLQGSLPSALISLLDDLPECGDSDGDGECDVNKPSE